MCSNDAKSCYARIVHAIASILMQHQNVPASACMRVFATIQNLHHTVMTIYGDSKSGYGGTLWSGPYQRDAMGSNGISSPGGWIWTLAMAPIVQSGTTSHRQDLDKLSHDLHIIQLH
jgi:hypothetical protein